MNLHNYPVPYVALVICTLATLCTCIQYSSVLVYSIVPDAASLVHTFMSETVKLPNLSS